MNVAPNPTGERLSCVCSNVTQPVDRLEAEGLALERLLARLG